jgi:predicted porin
MKKKMIVLAIGAGLAASAAHADVDLMGKEVQIYGKLHVSADYYDEGTTPAGVNVTGGELTSNSSRIGFKGEKKFSDNLSGVWKLESTIDVSGETGGLSARNRYLGVKGSLGTLIGGIHDTPFKEMIGYSIFGDTVGDSRNILGQLSDGTKLFNVRAASMLRYEIGAAGFSGALEFSPDANHTSNPDSNNNNNTVTSLRIGYKVGGFDIAGAYEKQDNINNTAHSNANGYRIGAQYKISALTVGGIFEGLTDDGYGPIVERNAYGVYVAYKISDVTLGGQYLKADASSLGNDGADNYTVGVSYELAKSAQIYAVYSSLANDSGASYVLGSDGHGQAYKPAAAGETVSSFSVGMSYVF